MNSRIKRRRFGQLLFSGAAASAIANWTGKAIAQSSESTIIGISLAGQQVLDNVANTTPEIILTTADVITGRQISQLNVVSTVVENVTAVTETLRQVISPKQSRARERLTDVTTLSEGRLLISSVVYTKQGSFSRYLISSTKSNKPLKAIKFTGSAKKNFNVESVLATKDNKFLSIISYTDGTPPFSLVTFDVATGKIAADQQSDLPDLVPASRYSNLAQAPDGTIYGVRWGSEGSPLLFKIDFKNRALITGKPKIIPVALLQVNKDEIDNDLKSIAFSPSGVLYGLGDPKSQRKRSLFKIDPKTGEMNFIREFAVDQIAFI